MEGPLITAITKKDNLIVCSYDLSRSKNDLEQILASLADNKINIDLFTYSVNTLQIVVDNSQLGLIEEINRKNNGLYQKAKIFEGLSRVSVIGLSLKESPGIAAKVIKILKKSEVDLEMISCSEINISCFINKIKADDVILALHKNLIEEKGTNNEKNISAN